MLRNYLSLENESSENNKVPQTGPEKMNVPKVKLEYFVIHGIFGRVTRTVLPH